MQVEIFLDGKLIGHGNLDAADPPMGVAAGPFAPSPEYEREVHAGEIELTHNPGGADLPYVVKSAEHGNIECHGVFIQDYADSLDERIVTLLGVTGYDALFSEHPGYKAYEDHWRRSSRVRDKRAERRRNIVTGLLLSICYWVVALPLWAFTQLGDPADQTPAGVQAAYEARDRVGLIVITVEIALYLVLLEVLRRRIRRDS